MFGVINSDTQQAWQSIANDVSRQRPYPGRTGTIVRGRKFKGQRVRVLRHQIDRYENVFRYGNEASHHMREMRGRDGFVCMVETESGERGWVKAKYIACDHSYEHWTVALSDAVDVMM